MAAHDNCQDTPEHYRYHVWLPKGRPECTVTLSCVCGAREVVDATRAEGASIVASCRQNGIPVVEGDQVDGVH